MFPLYFHYEDVSRQDPLLKLNHENVMEVPGLCKIRVVPKAAPSIKNGKLAMQIPCGQKCLQTQRSSTGRSFRSNPFLGSNKDKKVYVSDLARQSTLRQDETLPLYRGGSKNSTYERRFLICEGHSSNSSHVSVDDILQSVGNLVLLSESSSHFDQIVGDQIFNFIKIK